MKILEGKVFLQISRSKYQIQDLEGNTYEASLRPKLVMNYIILNIGDKVFIKISDDEKKEGVILTQTDFKLNGWSGWTSEHKP